LQTQLTWHHCPSHRLLPWFPSHRQLVAEGRSGRDGQGHARVPATLVRESYLRDPQACCQLDTYFAHLHTCKSHGLHIVHIWLRSNTAGVYKRERVFSRVAGTPLKEWATIRRWDQRLTFFKLCARSNSTATALPTPSKGTERRYVGFLRGLLNGYCTCFACRFCGFAEA
jgi:hypothetical protein